jgi:hypothetical protein
MRLDTFSHDIPGMAEDAANTVAQTVFGLPGGKGAESGT